MRCLRASGKTSSSWLVICVLPFHETAANCLLARYPWNADMISKLAHLLDAFYALSGSDGILGSSVRLSYMRRCCVFDVHVLLVCTAHMHLVLRSTLVHGNPSGSVSCSPVRCS